MSNLSEEERRLYCELAAFLAFERSRAYVNPEFGRAGHKLSWNQAMSAFEKADTILSNLGIIDNDNVLKIDVEDVAQFVEGNAFTATGINENHYVEFESVFANFVSLTQYGNEDRFFTHRRWFEVGSRYFQLMSLIAEQGYAEREGDKFRWTDKVGAIMQRACEWGEDNRPLLAFIEDDAAAAWETMPPKVKQYFLNDPVPFELAILIDAAWWDKTWHEPDWKRKEELTFDALQMATEIIDIIRNETGADQPTNPPSDEEQE